MNVEIQTVEDLAKAARESGLPHYVYVLCERINDSVVPFYVGIGQGERIFAHEDEARESAASNEKLEVIRSIWQRQESVVRYIDGFFAADPWQREEELINKWGLRKDSTGILTNSQRYSPSSICERSGAELRKYAKHGNELPNNFTHRKTRLLAGPREPKSASSVYGKICSVLKQNPGVTGEELVFLCLNVDFSGNKSAYTENQQVSLPWLAKYIDGGFYKKNECIQEFHDQQL